MSLPTLSWIRQNTTINVEDGVAQSTDTSIIVDSSGNCYIAYSTNGVVADGTSSDGTDIIVLKMNSNGDVVWRKQNSSINTGANDTHPSLGVDISQNIYLAYVTLNTSYDINLVKMNSNGDVLWRVTNIGTVLNDTAPSLAINQISGISYLACQTPVAGQGPNISVYKVDTTGNVVWNIIDASMNTSQNDLTPSVAVDSLDNVYVSYRSSGTVVGGTSSGNNDIIVFKLNSLGALQWTRQNSDFNTSNGDTAPSIAVDSSGNIYVSYETQGTVSGGSSSGNSDIAVFKLNSAGDFQWIKQSSDFNRSGIDSNPSICVDIYNDIYICYQTTDTSGSGGGVNDIIYFKLNSSGDFQWLYRNSAINTSVSDQLPSIAVNSNGDIFLGFQTTGTVEGGEKGGSVDIAVVRFTQAAFNGGGGGGGGPICFLGSAPVLTPSGYRRIDSLRAGDLVQTADGRAVTIQRVKTMVAQPGPNTDPFVIPVGRFGATAALPISPRHRVAVPGSGLVEARDIGGLARLPMRAAWTYYNLGLPNWETDNLVVGGVEVESLAPVERVRLTMAEFVAILTKKYGAEAGSKAVLDRVLATCHLSSDGLVEAPVIRRR